MHEGVTLDAVIIEGPPLDEKWLIWHNANGVAYEQILEDLKFYSKELGVSVLCYNYRGVGQSTGSSNIPRELHSYCQ